MARSVVQLWGNLNFGSIALMKNDWASVVLGWVVITGPCGYSFGFAPGLEITLPTHTKGTRPVKIPVPPRIWVRRSPAALPLKPPRGENSTLVPGSLL